MSSYDSGQQALLLEKAVRSEVGRLRLTAPEDLFLYLARATLRGDRQVFLLAVSAACDISTRGLDVMLDHPDARASWLSLYEISGMPHALFPAFHELVKLAGQDALPDPIQVERLAYDLTDACKANGIPDAKLAQLLD